MLEYVESGVISTGATRAGMLVLVGAFVERAILFWGFLADSDTVYIPSLQGYIPSLQINMPPFPVYMYSFPVNMPSFPVYKPSF
ncbi:hypothetical protein MAR_021371 [Mya arenaria]|uniref:Uncharacterized protein n=1 Tax=Mya arenaria TaxID=6604 RepID=A0ABY7EAN6_MYAAR|nr:hypothetical protein MAR_021371 [Mya arenaria]